LVNEFDPLYSLGEQWREIEREGRKERNGM